MSKWTVGAGDSRAVHEDGQYRGEMDSREQAARIVALLSEGEADRLRWRELYYAANAIKATTQILGLSPANGEIERLINAVDAIAGAPVSKEPAK